MAVDYFHRLLVSGKPADVRAFRDAIYREYPRTIAGETSETWTRNASSLWRRWGSFSMSQLEK